MSDYENMFDDLKSLTKRFLDNAEEKIDTAKKEVSSRLSPKNLDDKDNEKSNASLNKFKNLLRSRQIFSPDAQAPDTFDETLERLKRLRGNSAQWDQENIPSQDEVLAQPQYVPASSSSEKISEKPEETKSEIQETSTAPYEIINNMAVLLGEMVGKASSKKEYDWSDMDQLSAQIRKSWAQILTTKNTEKAKTFLPLWSTIVNDVEGQSQLWGDHSASWHAWAQKSKEEFKVLEMWLGPTLNTSFVVPEEFKNKGVALSAIPGVPLNLVQNLQACADFWEFAQQSSKRFYWKNTPNAHAFSQDQAQLNQWMPKEEELKQWKEDALDRYAVLEARFVLKSTQDPNLENNSVKKVSKKKTQKQK